MVDPVNRAIAKNAAYLAASRWVTVATRILYLFVLTRLLGPDLYGFFAYAQSWYLALLPLTSFGMQSLLPREVGLHGANAKDLIDTSLLVRLISAFVVTAGAIVIGASLEDSADLGLIVGVVTSALPARALSYWCATLLTAFEQTHYEFWFSVTFRLLEVFVGSLALWAGGGLLSIALVHLVAWCLNAATGLWLIHRRISPLSVRLDPAAIRLLFRQGIPMSIQGLLLEFLTSGPIVVYRHFSESPANLGQLALAFRILNVFANSAGAAMSAVIPAMSRSLKKGGNTESFYLRTAPTLMLIGGGMIALVTLLLGKPLILVIFGDAYSVAGHLLDGLAFAIVPQLAAMAIGQTLFVRGHIVFLLLATSIAVVTLLIVMLPLMHYWGVEGVIAAVIAARMLHLLLQAGFASMRRILSFADVILWPLLVVSAVTIACLIMYRFAPTTALAVALMALGLYLRRVLVSTVVQE